MHKIKRKVQQKQKIGTNRCKREDSAFLLLLYLSLDFMDPC